MKRTRQTYQIAEERGMAYSISGNTSLTANNILIDGYSFIKISGAFTLTLPVASPALKGCSVIVFCDNSSGKIAVAAGFGGGGASYDTVTPGAYCACKFWCDGSYWYALNESVAAS